jgi:hypothetical protein
MRWSAIALPIMGLVLLGMAGMVMMKVRRAMK